MTVDSVEAESRMEDVSVSSYVWGYVFLNSTQDHTGTQGSQAPELLYGTRWNNLFL